MKIINGKIIAPGLDAFSEDMSGVAASSIYIHGNQLRANNTSIRPASYHIKIVVSPDQAGHTYIDSSFLFGAVGIDNIEIDDNPLSSFDFNPSFSEGVGRITGLPVLSEDVTIFIQYHD